MHRTSSRKIGAVPAHAAVMERKVVCNLVNVDFGRLSGKVSWRSRYTARDLTIGEAVPDRNVVAFDIAHLLQASVKLATVSRDWPSRNPTTGIAARLLRARQERPRHRRAAEQRDELAPS